VTGLGVAHMASGKMRRLTGQLFKHRTLRRTNIFGEWAPGAKATAAGRIDWIRRIAGKRRGIEAIARIGRKPRGKQRLGVGMLRLSVDRLGRADLDDSGPDT
jgi:hypothetical protein